jgi:hypothetical protein
LISKKKQKEQNAKAAAPAAPVKGGAPPKVPTAQLVMALSRATAALLQAAPAALAGRIPQLQEHKNRIPSSRHEQHATAAVYEQQLQYNQLQLLQTAGAC